jgi:hypothetical protein
MSREAAESKNLRLNSTSRASRISSTGLSFKDSPSHFPLFRREALRQTPSRTCKKQKRTSFAGLWLARALRMHGTPFLGSFPGPWPLARPVPPTDPSREWLSLLIKSPQSAPGLYPEHDLFFQSMKLKNTLRHIMGEELITHLGLEHYD